MKDKSELLREMEKAMDRYDLSKEIEKAYIGEWMYGVAMVPCDWVYEYVKKQEAIKPSRHYARCCTNHKGMDFWYNCGSCKAEILKNDKYCHECGQAVKWE